MTDRDQFGDFAGPAVPVQPSPLPWAVGPFGDIWSCIERRNGKWAEMPGMHIVAGMPITPEREANADLIVRAVNSHRPMLSALTAVEEYLADITGRSIPGYQPKRAIALHEQVRAVLAKHGGDR